MDGVVPKLGVGAIRLNSDILTFPSISDVKRRVKVPAAPNERYTGLVLLFSTTTGEPLAIFPDGMVQPMRVAATTALRAQTRRPTRSNSLVVDRGQLGLDRNQSFWCRSRS
jgi:ornithine cyclodeaminase/alanine dehydrogenase-like protein (mu-crystallin family)